VRFTHQEAEEILKRAGDHESARIEGDVSLSELLRTAEEVGLSRESVLAALPCAQPAVEEGKAGLFGGPLSRSAYLVVDGALTEAKWQQILQELRRGTGDAGESRQDGEGWQWKATFGGIQTMVVTVRPTEEGKTRIDVSSSLNGLAAIVHVIGFGGILMTGPLVAALAPLTPLQTGMAWLAGGAGLFWAARSALNSLSERDGERTIKLLHNAASILGEEDRFSD